MSMPEETSDKDARGELCRTCGRPRNNHPYRHPFTGFYSGSSLGEGDAPASNDAAQAIPSSLPSVGIASGGDLVLRMALMRLGLITTDDLAKVVDELNASGVAGYEPPKALG